MARTLSRRRVVALVSAAVVLGACARDARASLPDGLYPVVPAAQPGARAVVFDPRLADPDDEGRPEVLAIDPGDFVPLGRADGARAATSDGRVAVSLVLPADQAPRLASFTERHLGGRVALALGGEVVSAHGVKAVIRGGAMQISRCSPRGCDLLLVRLARRRADALPKASGEATATPLSR